MVVVVGIRGRQAANRRRWAAGVWCSCKKGGVQPIQKVSCVEGNAVVQKMREVARRPLRV